ncbi:hypothetical protein EGJ27_05465 [Pseudomonas sp. v388]|uniref:hypothetical protein n=1 Tax=Pseudomonas sp. v388 TaxID=2479849 RepID=UPI000F76B35E|nr:hypothetical protein [Pseudomonas sp. v388]RRV09220.1 hypothetical protein EGJ27_05465 [Pseudomonas sp. v388]
MAKYEIRLSTEDFEQEDQPEIAIEFYQDDELQDNAWVTLRPKGKHKIRGDLGRDEEVLIDLALSFKEKVSELAER